MEDVTRDEVLSFLNRISLFNSLPDDFKTVLAQRLELREFKRNEIIVREGDAGDSMFVIADGRVAVLHEDDSLGLKFELARLNSGQVFGEMSILTEEPRSATCRALEDTKVYELKAVVFVSLLKRAPLVAIGVCRILAGRVAELNRRQGVQVLKPDRLVYDPEVYSLLPPQILQKHKLIPLTLEGGQLLVATPEAGNPAAIDAMRRCLPRVDIQPAMINERDYGRFIERNITAPHGRGLTKPGAKASDIHYLNATDDVKEGARATGEVVQLLNRILVEAISSGASDLHFEPTRDCGIVKFRVDGRIKQLEELVPFAKFRPLITRLKRLAGMDIAERRLPQEGRLSVSISERVYDLRASTLPSTAGEKIALRVLDSHDALRRVEDLVILPEVGQMVKQLAHTVRGVFITCGPNGSGKTNTAYSLLNERLAPDCNVATVEDPIEYDLPGVVQVQVNDLIGLTYPNILRAMLRQDTDVILVGEIRDATTSTMVLEAGLSGHQIISTIHADSAAAALIRLRDMGSDPFTLANALTAVIGQRLAQRLCPACSRPTRYKEHILEMLVQDGVIPEDFSDSLYAAPGCTICAGTGYKGRIAVFEVLPMTGPMRSLVSTSSYTVEEIREVAVKQAYVPILAYAAAVLERGLTTPQEVLRILHTAEGERP